MSQLFHKILRKPINGSTIRALITHQTPTQAPIPHLFQQPQKPTTQNPNLEPSFDDKTTLFNPLHVYPSFSFGCFLNPISSTGLPGFNPEEGPKTDGSGSMIWADSVKKKRKKKMNKHKLKKLKKRLRHCS